MSNTDAPHEPDHRPAVGGPVERMVMQHTPGPWQCSARPSGPWWHIGAGNQSVCTVHACSKKHTPVYAAMFKANADLIAAAPDLLNALRSLLRHAERMQEVMDEECGIRFRDDGPMSMARDALTRAVDAA